MTRSPHAPIYPEPTSLFVGLADLDDDNDDGEDDDLDVQPGWQRSGSAATKEEEKEIASMIKWNNPPPIRAYTYVCGHCGTKVAPEKGMSGVEVVLHNFQAFQFDASMCLCTNCGMPTVFLAKGDPTEAPFQTPGPAYGDAIPNLPEKVEAIYDEARKSMTMNAFTGVAMLCRALVAHVAVQKGAPIGLSFKHYVEWLDGQHGGQHFLPPGGAAWIHHIRDLGNDANHDLIIVTEAEARELIDFSGHLLRIVYDFPARMAKK